MKVRELIEQLQKVHQEYDVHIRETSFSTAPIDSVELSADRVILDNSRIHDRYQRVTTEAESGDKIID